MSKVFHVEEVLHMLDDIVSDDDGDQVSNPILSVNEESYDNSVSYNENILDPDHVILHIFEANSEEEDVDDGRVEFTVHFENNKAELIEKIPTTVVTNDLTSTQFVTDNKSALNINDSEIVTCIDGNNNELLNVSTTSSADVTGESDVESLNQNYSTETGRSRKRKRNSDNWKQTVRKKRRQSGQSYESVKGKNVRSRELKHKHGCNGKCKYRCTESFTVQDRTNIFNEFWSLSDNEKFAYYLKTTERYTKERTRTSAEKSRRKYSFRYFLISKGSKVRVCKEFYLSTLDISSKRISVCHEKVQTNDHSYRRGNHMKRFIPDESKKFVVDHINSFPRIESHYCRASTNKQYLESNLSVVKMYEMYCDKCQEQNIEPVKKHTYYDIFNKQFNLAFHVPKKDVCDACAENEMNKNNYESFDAEKFQSHIKDKTETFEERKKDRTDISTMVICFDLENVLSCPRSNTGNFFYKRKLSVYNLTAHCSKNRKAYNALWGEHIAGRGANEIASALCRILKDIINEYPQTEDIILWSDSCIPQNRNSMMTLALKTFLQAHPNIKTLTQKYCTPGHSSIQEVDNIHSHIEKGLKISDIYSPLSLVRVMQRIRPKFSKVIQLSYETFFNYKRSCKSLNFTGIPFSKVKCILISNDAPFIVRYKTSFADESYKEVSIRNIKTRSDGVQERYLPISRPLTYHPEISKEKKLDIISMLSYMPKEEQDYFVVACKLQPLLPKKKSGARL